MCKSGNSILAVLVELEIEFGRCTNYVDENGDAEQVFNRNHLTHDIRKRVMAKLLGSNATDILEL